MFTTVITYATLPTTNLALTTVMHRIAPHHSNTGRQAAALHYPKFMKLFFTALVVILSCLANIAAAQEADTVRAYPGYYDLNAETAISGTVTRVKKLNPPTGSPLLILEVKTNTGNFWWVHLGPYWFADEQCMQFMRGDKVVVTGAQAIMDCEMVIIAKTVQVGDIHLRLRDDTGVPLWSGSSRNFQ